MGVPPSPATKALLEQGLNVVGRVVKTSKYKFADWNIKLPKGTTKLPEAEFKKLSRAAQYFREGFYTQEDIKKIQADARLAKEAEKKAKEATKLAKESKNLWDKFLSKAKGSSQAAKAVASGGTVAKAGDMLIKFAPIITALIAIGISVAVNQIQGWRSDINETGQQKLSDSISKILGLMNGQNQRIKLANEGVQAAKLENQRVKDRIYGIEKQQPAIRESIADAKKKSNDALYEIRAGKVKLEADIAAANKKSNDALYETRTGRTKLETEITEAKKQANDALYETRTGRTKLEAEITEAKKQANDALYETRTGRTKLEAEIGIEQKGLQETKSRVGASETKIANLEKSKPTPQDTEIKATQDTTKKTAADLFAAVARLVQLEKIPYIVETLKAQVKTIETEHPKRWGIAVNQVDEKLSGKIATVSNDANTKLTKLETDQKKISADVDILTTKTKEQEKVNQSAIPKLDQILGILPFIPARTADVIRPSIPTVPQIENAAKTGTCQTFQPGGCGANALNGLGNGINQNTNNQSNNLFDKINAGANAAQLGLLKIIDNKLGAQIVGGISGKLVAGFKWLQLDRALNVLTFAATVQNHVMLSNNIAETLFGALNNVLKIIGFKNDNGEPFTLSSSIEALVKGIVGAEDYAVISSAWAKANRIYQASSNVLNAFQSLTSTILSGMELIAGNTSKIGNALRKAGEVLENAYGWMNPQPKFNRVTQTLESLNQGASTIQQVTQIPLDTIEALTGLQTANTEFVKALQEDDKPGNKSTELPEPNVLKAVEKGNKAVSAGKNLADVDKEEDE